MAHYAEREVGNHRGAPRVWLQGEELAHAGFRPGDIYAVEHQPETKCLVLRLDRTGSRVVTPKRVNGIEMGCIDLNSHRVIGMFEGLDCVQVVSTEGAIYIRPTKVAERKAARLARLREELANGMVSTGSVSHGIGMLDSAVCDGLEAAGFKPKTMFINEIRQELVELAAANNSKHWTKDTVVLSAPLQSVAFDPVAMSMIRECSVLIGGLPCSGASVAGRSRKGTSMAEEHDVVGHLILAFTALAAKANFAALVFENVLPYFSSASMAMLRTTLKEWGYVLHEQSLNAWDYGSLEARKRGCLVAVTEGMDFDWAWVQPQVPATRIKLGDVLDFVPQGDPRWSEMAGLRAKEVRDAEAGKGFAMQTYDANAEKIGCLTKGLMKNRSTDVKIQSPFGDGMLRIPTPEEHSRIKGFDIARLGDASNTLKHEMLGQGVVIAPFFELAKQGLARSFKLFMEPASASKEESVEAVAANDDLMQLDLFGSM